MIVTHPNNTLNLDIGSVEKYYGAKFVGEFPFPVGDSFADKPVCIFHRPPKLVGANTPEYFAIKSVHKKPFGLEYGVSEASYVTEYIFNGLELNGEVIYSRFETDKASFDDDNWIEGGFSSCEHKGGSLVRLQVQDGVVVILE